MGTPNSGTPAPSDAREHAESSHNLDAILQAAIEQKSFGTSLDGLKYRDVEALRSMIRVKQEKIIGSWEEDIRVAERRGGIRGKIGAVIGRIPGFKKGNPTSNPSTIESSGDEMKVLNELKFTTSRILLQKREKEFSEADKTMRKVADDMSLHWTDESHISIGEINIAPTRRNHGHIQVGYEQSPEEMRDFIAAHMDESRKINSQIEIEIAAINEDREVTFDISNSEISFGANRAKEDIELENQFPSKSLDIDDAIARMRELAGADER